MQELELELEQALELAGAVGGGQWAGRWGQRSDQDVARSLGQPGVQRRARAAGCW